MRAAIPSLLLLVLLSLGGRGAEPVLGPAVRAVPGEQPTAWLRYVDPAARKSVHIAGQWNQWSNQVPLRREGEAWSIDTRTLPGAREGRLEYKFIVDDAWEPGDNRVLFLNERLELERPPDVIASASLEKRDEILVLLKQPLPAGAQPAVRLSPAATIANVDAQPGATDTARRGYRIAGNAIVFVFDPAAYGQPANPDAQVTVAGNFNSWQGGSTRLKKAGETWELGMPLDALKPLDGDAHLVFKFVVNGTWMQPPANCPNAQPDGKGNTNLRIDKTAGGSASLTIKLAAPLPLDVNHTVLIDGLADRRARATVAPGRALDAIVSTRSLGATLDRTNELTTYRLFAPRATAVSLCFFDGPAYERHTPAYTRLPPAARYPMFRDPADGTWSVTTVGLDTGKYYMFTVDGPQGDGENFMGGVYVGDPYGQAAAHAENCAIVVDHTATNEVFGGWTDQAWQTPALEDAVIYETHLRHLTIDPSSGVPAALRGKYGGLTASLGTGTGLDHIRAVGANLIEFLPLAEFNNGETNHNWGYSTAFYFAPEASYAQDPRRGSQVQEFKRLVNDLHRAGFGVIMDVVYNHVGSPNAFALIDKKYYFRLTPDHQFINFSGVGNDVRSEAPMMRRLIVDNMVHWAREYHVDGFRLDLAELIDMETLRQAREAVLQVNPRAIVISEPWSFRGDHKQQLRGTGWSGWNNDFRYAIKDFVRGRADRNQVRKVIAGSTEIWTANPLQAINYVESHDDMALVDELSGRPDHDGRNVNDIEAMMNRLCAAVLYTSLGVPMIGEGQEFLRSKRGVSNTFDRGDEYNALRWSERERPLAASTQRFYADLARLRRSPEGAAFRVREAPSGYLQWIEPPDARLLGFVINAGHVRPGRAFVVLLNAANMDAEFAVPFPAGTWRQISDGRTVNMTGTTTHEGGRTVNVRVPFGTAFLFMD